MTPKRKIGDSQSQGRPQRISNVCYTNTASKKVIVVDDNFQLKGLITVNDFTKAENNPNACRDSKGRLRVGAAVGTGADTEVRVEGSSLLMWM